MPRASSIVKQVCCKQPISEMCAAEGLFKAIRYRYVNPDGTPTESLRDLTCIGTLTLPKRLDSESG
jgi:hypothetical protein